MDREVHFFLGCTNRKRRAPSAALELRNLRRVSKSRADAWIRRVDKAEPSIAISDLYSGDSWYVGRRLGDSTDGCATLWALSAGYGLVHGDDVVAPYGATLTTGHPDSVYRPEDPGDPQLARQRWWRALAAWPGPAGTARPRTIAAVAAMHPYAAFLVCAGRPYVQAVADDLAEAQGALTKPDRLMIFGSGRCPDARLDSSWIRLPANLRLEVGGSMGSLSVRAANRALRAARSDTLGAPSARTAIQQLAARAGDLPRIVRRQLDDDEIAVWISKEVQLESGLTKTVALRRLRDQGFACEQRRFGFLFQDVQVATQ